MTKRWRDRTRQRRNSIEKAPQGQSFQRQVGYGRPPRAYQFKPGKSGNPKGRPKGAKNEATILRELLYRRIPVRIGGRVRKIPVIEAIHLRFTEDSLRGNTKSAAFIFNRLGSLSSERPEKPELTDDDRDILDAFAERLLSKRGLKGEEP